MIEEPSGAYGTAEDVVSGVVITLAEITTAKRPGPERREEKARPKGLLQAGGA
jgi:hypothetical protein